MSGRKGWDDFLLLFSTTKVEEKNVKNRKRKFEISSTMSNVIRRFISYVGKVKLSDFRNPSHKELVEKYCNDQETRVSRDQVPKQIPSDD